MGGGTKTPRSQRGALTDWQRTRQGWDWEPMGSCQTPGQACRGRIARPLHTSVRRRRLQASNGTPGPFLQPARAVCVTIFDAALTAWRTASDLAEPCRLLVFWPRAVWVLAPAAARAP